MFGRHVGGIDDILDGDGDAVERPGSGPHAPAFVRYAGLGHGMLGIEIGPGLDVVLSRLDTRDASADIFLGRHLAAIHTLDRFGGRERDQLRAACVHRHTP